MFLTSLLLLVAAVVLIIWGAIKGSVLLLGISVGCGAAGAVALLIANAVAPRLAKAAGVTAAGQGLVTTSAGAVGAVVTPTDTPPIPAYNEMTAAQLVRVVGTGSLGKPALAALLAYEASHQARTTVITSLEGALGVKARAR